jgi:lipoate-protein ligase A
MECLDRTLRSAAEDLALDEALLIEADLGLRPALVRFWEPAHYAVVLGASRSIRQDVHAEACLADGVPILRRSSGGGTVVVGPGCLNVTFILPETAAPGLAAVDLAHRFVLERLAASLRQLGLSAAVEGLGDLVVGGRKCAGSAQRRLKAWFMVHCSILNEFSLERITRYLPIPQRQPAYRAGRPHAEFLSNLHLPRKILVDAIRASWSAGRGASCARALPLQTVQTLISDKFGNPLWIERF